MEDPDKEIHELIRFAGERNQIFNVHMRNIKGGWGNFQEVYPDNGDMAFLKVMRSLRDVQYKHMVMPDHVPKHPDDPDGSQGFAFCYGYLGALIKAVNAEAEALLALLNANTAFANSLITTRLNLVHLGEITYQESGNGATDLLRLTNPGDGFIDGIHSIRDSLGADNVSLFVSTINGCGISWLMNKTCSTR